MGCCGWHKKLVDIASFNITTRKCSFQLGSITVGSHSDWHTIWVTAEGVAGKAVEGSWDYGDYLGFHLEHSI